MPLSSRIRLLLALGLAMAPARGADWHQDCVAVVESLSGGASVREHGTANPTAAFQLEWLPNRSTIEVGPSPDSSLTVILLNGQRYQLGPRAKGTVTAEELTGQKGPVQPLKALPAIETPPIAGPYPRARLATRGAARIRGPGVRDLYPRNDMAVLPASVKLSFRPVTNASSYQVEVEELEGEQRNPVFNLHTRTSGVVIPDGILKPHKGYSWRIVALLPEGEIQRAEATFVTISDDDMACRAAFAKAMEGAADQASAMALLADLDFRLGLLREARNEFEAALKMKPEPAIRHALDLVLLALNGAPE